MTTFLALTIPSIIGQTTMSTLASFRAPAFLPGFLFESHLVFWIGALFIATVIIAAGLTRHRRLLLRLGIIGEVLLILWIILAALIVTPRERLEAVHRAILTAAQAKDAPAITRRLASDFSCGPYNRETMAALIDATLQSLTIKSNTVRLFDAALRDTTADSQFNIFTTLDAAATEAAGGYLTQWHLEWRDDPATDWQLVRITRWSLNNQEMPLDLKFDLK